jgi:hypothetical protein
VIASESGRWRNNPSDVNGLSRIDVASAVQLVKIKISQALKIILTLLLGSEESSQSSLGHDRTRSSRVDIIEIDDEDFDEDMDMDMDMYY